MVGLRGLEEREHLEDRVGHEGRVGPQDLLDRAAREVRRRALVLARAALERQRVEHVVVQVVTDRQVSDHLDAVVLEVLGVTDAAQHQDLSRADEAGREDDLLAGPDGARGAVAVLGDVGDLDADRPAVLDDHLAGQRLGLQLEGLGREVVDVAARGAVAQPARGVLLHPADALLRLTVVVVEDLAAGRVRGGLEELEGALLGPLVDGDLDRAAGAAEGVLAALEVLHPLVRRVDAVGVPAGVALGGPVVEVGAVAAHVDHAVDRARAADDLASRDRHLAVEDVLLRHRVVAPVDGLLDLGHRVHRADHAGLLGQELVVGLARLDHDHAGAGLGQTAGDRRTGGAGSDHDVVGFIGVGSTRGCTQWHGQNCNEF